MADFTLFRALVASSIAPLWFGASGVRFEDANVGFGASDVGLGASDVGFEGQFSK